MLLHINVVLYLHKITTHYIAAEVNKERDLDLKLVCIYPYMYFQYVLKVLCTI